MSDQVFKFTMKMPMYYAGPNCYDGMMRITMTAPVFVFPFRCTRDMRPDTAKRLGAAELKVKMIKALIDGEWEIE